MARLSIHSGRDARVYEILDDRIDVGSADDNDVRLVEAAAHHLRILRRGNRYHVMPRTHGVLVWINGASARPDQALQHGDRIEVGDGIALVFEDPDNPAARPLPVTTAEGGDTAALADALSARLGLGSRAPRPADAPGAGTGSARRGERSRSRPRRTSGPPRFFVMTTAVTASVVLVLVMIRLLSATGPSSSPQALLNLAHHQEQTGRLDLALDTLSRADAARPDEPTRSAIEALADDIRRRLQRDADRPALQAAEIELRTLRQFADFYLKGPPFERAPARDLVRRATRWLEEYAAVCRRHPDAAPQVEEVEALRARVTPAAHLGEPDRAEDAIFRARHLVRLRQRRYRDAIAELDGWLAEEPTDDRIRALRDELTEDGEDWLRGQIRRIRAMLERDRPELAREEFERLQAQGLPAWTEDLLAMDREIAAAERR